MTNPADMVIGLLGFLSFIFGMAYFVGLTYSEISKKSKEKRKKR